MHPPDPRFQLRWLLGCFMPKQGLCCTFRACFIFLVIAPLLFVSRTRHLLAEYVTIGVALAVLMNVSIITGANINVG